MAADFNSIWVNKFDQTDYVLKPPFFFPLQYGGKSVVSSDEGIHAVKFDHYVSWMLPSVGFTLLRTGKEFQLFPKYKVYITPVNWHAPMQTHKHAQTDSYSLGLFFFLLHQEMEM